jgi:hypothetical protein
MSVIEPMILPQAEYGPAVAIAGADTGGMDAAMQGGGTPKR